MKYIAFHLPAYHRIPENDQWWGEGFTEWDNVRKGKPLFRHHDQPHIPLGHHYYDLSDPTEMERQSETALKYGLDGFCYYHYWFNGKLLLEKPLEDMLANPKVKIPFMLSWANESWARTWDGKERDILIAQNYDKDEKGWTNHYNYIRRFFLDSRYIKKGNKPVFIIYKPYLFPEIGDFIACWNKLAQNDGFDGIFFGYQFPDSFKHSDVTSLMDFGILFEPIYTLRNWSYIKHPFASGYQAFERIIRRPYIYGYDAVWKQILKYAAKLSGDKVCPGAFPSWDNTPRKGKNGVVFHGASPAKFNENLLHLSEIGKQTGAEFLFVNAWNEWGECAHLEPDEKYHDQYLDAILLCKKRFG